MTQELRAPLQVLMGFGGILHREVAGTLTPRQHDYLNKLLGSASVMAHLIDSVLDAGRVARGELSLTPQILDFTELLESAIAGQRAEAVSHHQHVEIDIPTPLPVLYADSERLHQVITELLGNAIKFTPDGGTIRVRAREEGARVLCEVENTGEGLSREALSRMFQPYASLEPALAKAETGVGLGLHVSRAIAEAHGGTLQVESHPGAGSVFRLSLPTLDSNRLLEQRFPAR
ncbi:Non-motile and phage-resistance protein [compost metagenome]